MRRLAVVLGLVSAILVIPAADAFGGGGGHEALGGGGGCHTGRQEMASTTVDMAGICFTQTVVHVSPGQSVTWTNHDEMQHTVTGVGSEWGDYEPIGQGATFSTRFDDAGVFPYFCAFHPGMVGAVVVDSGTGGAVAAATPVAAVSDGGSSELAWWITGSLVVLMLLAGGIYLLERVRPGAIRPNPTG